MNWNIMSMQKVTETQAIVNYDYMHIVDQSKNA